MLCKDLFGDLLKPNDIYEIEAHSASKTGYRPSIGERVAFKISPAFLLSQSVRSCSLRESFYNKSC